MGSSESKLAVESERKPELPFKPGRVNQLIDPRSPSVGIDRTPIQVVDAVKSSAEVKGSCPLAMTDPRSPTVGITRTPVREFMRARFGTLVRRLGMVFHNVPESRVQEICFDVEEEEEDPKTEEMASTEPLLTPQPPQTLYGFMDVHDTTPATPLLFPPQSVESPFVLPEDPQLEIELETEPDISLDEAEEAQETPLNKRLSMSLITCHEGASSTQINDYVHTDSFSTLECGVDSETVRKEDHSCAVPSITTPSPVVPSAPDAADEACVIKPSGQSEDAVQSVSMDKTLEEVVEAPCFSLTSPSLKAQTTVHSPRAPHIRCPTIDSKSPSQVVFKPQWLINGFGGAGQRVRVQGHTGKSGSSPLALRVAVTKVMNENNGQTGKPKLKGTEGRSPLQILKEPNLPRGQQSPLSSTEKQRSAHTEGRMLAITLDKENR